MKINDVLLNEIANLICTSEKQLTDDQFIILRSKEYSGYKSLSDPRSIARILPMVDQRLHGSVSEGLPHEIHFKNGYINVKTAEFESEQNLCRIILIAVIPRLQIQTARVLN